MTKIYYKSHTIFATMYTNTKMTTIMCSLEIIITITFWNEKKKKRKRNNMTFSILLKYCSHYFVLLTSCFFVLLFRQRIKYVRKYVCNMSLARFTRLCCHIHVYYNPCKYKCFHYAFFECSYCALIDCRSSIVIVCSRYIFCWFLNCWNW